MDIGFEKIWDIDKLNLANLVGMVMVWEFFFTKIIYILEFTFIDPVEIQ